MMGIVIVTINVISSQTSTELGVAVMWNNRGELLVKTAQFSIQVLPRISGLLTKIGSWPSM